MNDTKRALRRHHRRRMIARACHVFYLYRGERSTDPKTREWTLRNDDHLKACSCWRCGNKRRWQGPTVQERRRSQAMAYEMAQWYGGGIEGVS